MYLSDASFEAYLLPLEPAQVEVIRLIRGLICNSDLELEERIEIGKWYTGLLVYDAPGGITTYALGPLPGGNTTFHMMALYGSQTLQKRHVAALKQVLSGKSCIKMRGIEQVPTEAIRDIIASGPRYVELATRIMQERTTKAKRQG